MTALAAVLLGACIPQSAFTTTATPPSSAAAALSPSGPAACRVVNLLPTPGPSEIALYPPPTESDWKLGPDTAQVTFMEYSDFQ